MSDGGGGLRRLAVSAGPPPDEVCTFVCRRPGWGLLLDTWGKDGLTLLDWMSRVEIGRMCRAVANPA